MYCFGLGKIIPQCRLKRNILKSAVDLIANTSKNDEISIAQYYPSSLVLPLLQFGAVQYIYIYLVRRNHRISFFLRVEMLSVLYILEALRHNIILKDFYLDKLERIQNNYLIFSRLRVKILNVLYILEALRHNHIMPGLLPG